MKGKDFPKRKIHPLGWGDVELQWLIGQGVTMVNLYRCMGYKGSQASLAFTRRVEKLKEGIADGETEDKL